MLPPRVATVIGYADVAIIGLFALLLVWFGWQFFINTTRYNMVSYQIQVHQRFVAACVSSLPSPFGCRACCADAGSNRDAGVPPDFGVY
jgi:hypothetical protein